MKKTKKCSFAPQGCSSSLSRWRRRPGSAPCTPPWPPGSFLGWWPFLGICNKAGQVGQEMGNPQGQEDKVMGRWTDGMPLELLTPPPRLLYDHVTQQQGLIKRDAWGLQLKPQSFQPPHLQAHGSTAKNTAVTPHRREHQEPPRFTAQTHSLKVSYHF